MNVEEALQILLFNKTGQLPGPGQPHFVVAITKLRRNEAKSKPTVYFRPRSGPPDLPIPSLVRIKPFFLARFSSCARCASLPVANSSALPSLSGGTRSTPTAPSRECAVASTDVATRVRSETISQ